MNRRLAFALGLSVISLLVAMTGWRVVGPGERIVVRRFGRIISPDWGPGLHWGAPLGIDRFDSVRTDLVQRVNLGPAPEAVSDGGLEAAAGADEFLTGDLNLVRMRAVVQYRVARPAELMARSADVGALLERLAEASLSRALARRGIDAVLRADRERIAGELGRNLEQTIARLRLGLEILGVSLIEARPPDEVAADFSAAQSAESQRDRRGNEARTQAETTVTAARAAAGSRLEAARAAAQRTLLGTRAAAERFLALLAEARRMPEATARRIYLDTMKSLLGRVRRKIIVPPGDDVELTVLGIDE
jgi:membrane protease subunit HflK